MKSEKLQVYVYHHTHWDREWWTTMQDLRISLVELIDELLETLDEDPEFRCFLLDGQTIVLKDYLEIRPENQEKLLNYIRDHRIQCGPWYILPDEFLVSGEAHIRNLWLGERMAEQLGYENLKIGYLPDTFGHISQMPQILRGFGIDNALIWRGIGGDPKTFKQEFMWEGADNSQVLTYWFPDGYYVVDFLHFDNREKTYEETYGRVRKSIERWSERATTNCLLMPYGGDHLKIDKRLPRLLKQVNEDVKEFAELHWSTTEEYMNAIKEQAPDLNVVKGELREFGEGHPHVLPGILSSRLYLKQLNFTGQNWLERYAEPFSTLAWTLGRNYESRLLWTAWELLVQNHPHDSICGCSIDEVHQEMLPRFAQSRQIAEIVTEKSIQHINRQINTGDLDEGEAAVVVHNPLAWRRTDAVNVRIDREQGIDPKTHILRDCEGNTLSFQVKEADGTRLMSNKWQYNEIRFVAEDLPVLGYKTYRLSKRDVPLDPKQKRFSAVQVSAKLKGSERVTDLQVGSNVLENEYIKIKVNEFDGTFLLVNKRNGDRYEGLNAFEDGGDAGDTYAYAAPLNDVILTSNRGARVHTTVTEAGYSSATLRIDLDWQLPKALSPDRLGRESDYQDTRISTFITLTSKSKRADIKTTWENVTKDHRLRALFPVGENAVVSRAEGHFDVVERTANANDKGNSWPEPPVPTMPQQGYVTAKGRSRGLTIANKGLPEYELLQDGKGTVALTILRAVGWLSREDTLVRIGGAGPQTPTPDAQSIGKNSVEYSIIPDTGSDETCKTAHDFLTPLYGSITDKHQGKLPVEQGFLEVDGPHSLVLSALKKAEKSDAVMLRFWNASKEKITTAIRFKHRPSHVEIVDLSEVPTGKELEISEDGKITLKAAPAEIVTISVNFS